MERIRVRDISKNYRDVKALDRVNLEFEKGKIYGLLGRNGAGKSTLLKIIAGRIKASDGQVIYDGEALLNDETSRGIYFSEPDNILPESMKVRDFCRYTSQFYPRFNLEEASRILKDFGVDEKKRLNQLSTGYFAIVRSVVALHTRADFIFLDEPTLGHDAVSRELFYDEVLRIYREEENTILLSTHLIDEISNLLEEVIFIDHGRIVLEDNMENMMASYFYLAGPADQIKEIEGSFNVVEKKIDLGFASLLVQGSDEESVLPTGIRKSRAGLQDIFIARSKKNNE
ncbi:MAG: ABC transporter ATP-binding protein [Clostridiales bacterium]|nr:ABC transporter ATP-binding protein [Clostridiales bacterium]